MTPALLLCGAVALAGMALVVSGLRPRRPDPVRRGLGPYAPAAPRSLVAGLLDRWDSWAGAARQLESRRLLRLTHAQHRRHQSGWMAGTATLAALLGLLRDGAPAALFLAAVAVPIGLLCAEQALHRRAARRRAELSGQVLGVMQHIALAVSAGETAAEAIGRAATAAPQPIAVWLHRVDAQIRSGRGMEAALTEAADVLDVAEFTLLADTLVAATARGAPLAATLLAQVRDSRARGRAAAMQRAGRADIAMLLPIVALVLPAVVVVALYPGFVALTSM